MFKFNNTYINLPDHFYQKQEPNQPSRPSLLAFNEELAFNLGLEAQKYPQAQLANWFSGKELLPGAEPLAMAYAGHQFAHFVPQLGDGRALLLGEVTGKDGIHYDIQLKGSGPTQFSRRGDGKSALGPVVREYIVSEAMHHLGVPTTRALAAVSTGEEVYREELLPGGVFTRVAKSHIRVGTFQYFAFEKDKESIKQLADYSIERLYPELVDEPDKYLQFFKQTTAKQAQLVTQWLSFGFIHGVMNTDNTSISGETIDYGPCAFMDNFSFDRVFSSIDSQGRYAYANQPNIILWNMTRLADCLIPIVSQEEKTSISRLEQVLVDMNSLLEESWLKLMSAKLGIINPINKDLALISSWLKFLSHQDLDFTLSFRNLSKILLDESLIKTYYPDKTEFYQFFQQWKNRINSQGFTLGEIASHMDQVNPVFIPRNHFIEEAIKQVQQENYEMFVNLQTVLKNPFTDQEKFEKLKVPPKPGERVVATFCGT